MFQFIINTSPQAASLNNLELWVPAGVSILSLFVNIIFSIFVAPRIMEKISYKSKLYDICSDFLAFLATATSLDSYDGAPTKIRDYSLKIHLMFKTGTAPQNVSNSLEELFQLMRQRKRITDTPEIEAWNESFRVKVREFRKNIAHYTGKL